MGKGGFEWRWMYERENGMTCMPTSKTRTSNNININAEEENVGHGSESECVLGELKAMRTRYAFRVSSYMSCEARRERGMGMG